MKIIKLKAGLGNQMFQYAFYRLLETEYGQKDVLLDIAYYKHPLFRKYLDAGINMLSVSYRVAGKKELRSLRVPYNGFKPHHFWHRLVVATQFFFNRHYFFERKRDYVGVESILHYSYFDGYWQSWKYLEPIQDILFKEFKPKNELSAQTQSYIEKFSSLNSVFIGIRKGDYTASAKATSHYGVPSQEYYEKAIEIILNKVKDPYFVVFSDDIDWVKKHFDFKHMGIEDDHIEYRDKHNIFSNFEELFVMASCSHAIISNSTFNFWGAWLIKNDGKVVVAPKEWFKDGKTIDIIPPSWIEI